MSVILSQERCDVSHVPDVMVLIPRTTYALDEMDWPCRFMLRRGRQPWRSAVASGDHEEDSAAIRS
jgi:hypothetical protein